MPLLSTQPPRDGYQGPKPLHDDDNAGTQPMSSLSCKGSTEPPCGDNADTEHLCNGKKVGEVPPCADGAPTEPDRLSTPPAGSARSIQAMRTRRQQCTPTQAPHDDNLGLHDGNNTPSPGASASRTQLHSPYVGCAPVCPPTPFLFYVLILFSHILYLPIEYGVNV